MAARLCGIAALTCRDPRADGIFMCRAVLAYEAGPGQDDKVRLVMAARGVASLVSQPIGAARSLVLVPDGDVDGPDPPTSGLSAGLPYRQPLSTSSAVTSARAKCSPASSSPVRPALNRYPCGVSDSPSSMQWELPEWTHSFTYQFFEGPVADRYVQARTCGGATADQPGRRRRRGWRTTPKAPQDGKTQVVATATP